MRKWARNGLRAPLVATLIMAAGIAACGSSKAKPAATATTASGAGGAGGAGGALFSKLPSAIQSAKEIKVGSDVSYAPIEFFKEGTQQVEGVDYDIGQALGAQLGVKVTFINTTFDGLIPALQANRFDMIMSAMTDNTTRQAKVDFVDYFTAGTAILTVKGNPKHINTLDDLCGKTVALEKGTTQADVATTQAQKCQSSGKPTLTVLQLDKDTDALQQLKIGRSDADMNDFPVAAYNAQTSGGGKDFEVVGQQFASAPYGIAIGKQSTQLRDAVQAALKAIIASGTYDQILNKWQVSAGALKTRSHQRRHRVLIRAGRSSRYPPDQIVAVPLRHWGRWVAAVILLALFALLVRLIIDSHFADFSVVRKYLFNTSILQGLRNTLIISILAQAAGIILGVLLAVMRLSKNPVLSVSSWLYIWLFRGTPVLVQLLFWFNAVPGVFKTFAISIPFTHVVLYHGRW